MSQPECELIIDSLLKFNAALDSISVEEKRAYLRTLVKKIVWDGERVHLYLFGSDEDAAEETLDNNTQTKADDESLVPPGEYSIFYTP